MHRGRRQPSPPRGGRHQHSPNHKRIHKRIFEKIFKKDYEAWKRKVTRKVWQATISFCESIAARLPRKKPLPQLRPRTPKPRSKSNTRRTHHERTPERKKRHKRHHISRRELSDAEYYRRRHEHRLSTPRPTKPKSSHHQARSHRRRPNRPTQGVRDSWKRSHEHGVSPPSFNPATTIAESDGDYCDSLTNASSTSDDGYDSDLSKVISGLNIDLENDFGVSTASDSEDGYDSDLSNALSDPDADHEDSDITENVADASPGPETDDNEGLNIATPSDSDDGYDSDTTGTSDLTSGADIDHDEDLSITAPADLEEHLTHTSTELRRDYANDHLNPAISLHAPSNTDPSETGTESDEGYDGDNGDADSSSHEESSGEEDDSSDANSCLSQSDGDMEENDCQVTIHPLQAEKIERSATPLDLDEKMDVSLSSRLLDSREDDQLQGIRNFATGQYQDRDMEAEETDSDFDGPQAGDSMSARSIALIEASPKVRGESNHTDSDSEDSQDEDSVSDLGNATTDVSSQHEEDAQSTDSDSEDGHSVIGFTDASTDASGKNEGEVDDADSDSDDYQDKFLVTSRDSSPVNVAPEHEGQTSHCLEQDEDYTGVSHNAGPKNLRTASIIAPAVHTSLQDMASSADSKAGSTSSHKASGTKVPEPQSLPDLPPGSIVRRTVDDDNHPYVITEHKLDSNGKPAVRAYPCTSRPKLKNLRKQYGENVQLKEISFCYLGGDKESKRDGDTTGILKPAVPDLDIEGPPMPSETYIKFKEGGLFDPSDFESFDDEPRRLTPESLERFLDILTSTTYMVAKKSPPGSVPAA